jgi:hypothetical protein
MRENTFGAFFHFIRFAKPSTIFASQKVEGLNLSLGP